MLALIKVNPIVRLSYKYKCIEKITHTIDMVDMVSNYILLQNWKYVCYTAAIRKQPLCLFYFVLIEKKAVLMRLPRKWPVYEYKRILISNFLWIQSVSQCCGDSDTRFSHGFINYIDSSCVLLKVFTVKNRLKFKLESYSKSGYY